MNPTQNPGIEVSAVQTTSEKEGNCNGCTRHTTAAGVVPHTVTMIALRGASVRLCPRCMEELRIRIDQLLEPEASVSFLLMEILQRIQGNPILSHCMGPKCGPLWERILTTAAELTGQPADEMRERFKPQGV